MSDELSEAIRAAAMRYEAELFVLVPGSSLPDPQRHLDSVPDAAKASLKDLIDRMASVYASMAMKPDSPEKSIQEGTLLSFVSGESIEFGNTIVSESAGENTVAGILRKEAAESQFAEDLKFADSDSGSTKVFELSEGGSDSTDSGEGITIIDRSSGEKGPVEYPRVRGYEILDELGRGGMGVVYKARQIKLNRIVALKMVLAGAHAGAEALGRFFTEAEAVALLVHPNIVQIFEVSEHDGIPFFSLEFVAGGSLADRLSREPMQASEAARLVEALARAMHAAHTQGVIHRDLKPANVLITQDGIPKITDFGLAKRMESDSKQTRSGTLMGTPSYMAPEQARGDTHKIGPPADTYAIGVILYECLTGRTPFVGTSVMDTLQQVQNLEPVPPRYLQPRVPSDLETICLKCLQKEADKRYASSQDLADDIARFIAGEPILARPISTTARVMRWAKRNPRVAALSASLLTVLLTLALGSTVAAFRISQARQNADIARLWAEQKAKSEERLRGVADKAASDAEKALQIADANAQAANQAAEEAKKAYTLAEANAKVANDQSALALNTLSLLVQKVQEQLENAPRTQQLKKDLLETAMSGLKQVAKHAESSTSTEATLAAAHMKMGQMFRQLGDTAEAFKQFELCHEITRKRALAHPNWAASQANLAATFTMLGNMSQEIRRDMKASQGYFQKALEIYQALNANPAGDGERPIVPLVAKRSLADTYTRLAVTALRLGDPASATYEFGKALEIREGIAREFPKDERAVMDLSRSYLALAEVQFRAGDRKKALEAYENCLAMRERMVQENPGNLRHLWDLSAIYGNLGDFRLHCDEPDAARPLYEKNLELSRKLVAEDPKIADFHRELSVALLRSGILATETKSPGAEALFQECLTIREKLAAEDPKNERRQLDLMLILPRVGQHARAAEIADRFTAQSGAIDPEILFETARCYAGCASASGVDDPSRKSEYEKKSLKAIEASIEAGYRDRVALETEPDLDPIRNLADFRKLLETMGSASAK
jgi:serine/threonine-protein kinase